MKLEHKLLRCRRALFAGAPKKYRNNCETFAMELIQQIP